MMKLRHLFENYDLAEEALNMWEHDKGSLNDWLQRFRISSNAIYPFEAKGELYFLRLAPVSEKLEKNIYGELEFINYLIQNGYPALKPVAAKNNKTVVLLDTEWGKYYASVFSCVPGIPIEDTDFDDAVMYAYGKALGQLHNLSAKFKPNTAKWDYREALSWIKEKLDKYEAPMTVIREYEKICNQIQDITVNVDNYGLVHYDFEPDNVFYDEQNENVAVIDFDDGMYNFYAVDIEQALDAISGEIGPEKAVHAEEKFMEGYRSEHVFTKEMEQMRPLMRRFCNLYGYTRKLRCLSDKFDEEPEWVAQLREKLNHVNENYINTLSI